MKVVYGLRNRIGIFLQKSGIILLKEKGTKNVCGGS
jgi:hypothetical protein